MGEEKGAFKGGVLYSPLIRYLKKKLVKCAYATLGKKASVIHFVCLS